MHKRRRGLDPHALRFFNNSLDNLILQLGIRSHMSQEPILLADLRFEELCNIVVLC